ncbi:MAG: SRPBCC domain-containing protein [Nocardioides sp.]
MSATTVTVSRTVPAPPGEVFDAWTDVAQLAAWWWPQLAGTTYALDARVGGSYEIVSPAIGATVRGDYTEVDRPHRLAFTWNWDDGEPADVIEDTVQVSFEARDGDTLVTVEHTSVQHAPDGGAEQGWSDVLDRLAGGFETRLRPSSTTGG